VTKRRITIQRPAGSARDGADWWDNHAPAIDLSGDAKPPPPFPAAGTVLLDRYAIVQRLGSGGADAVFEGLQLELERPVAIKMLPRHLASDPVTKTRFLREARLAGQLCHPHTITTYDAGQTEDGVLFIVREFLRGRSLLQALLAEGAFPWRHAMRVAQQVCGSLAEAHRKGIYHRDLKLGNIFLLDLDGEESLVKVLDYVNWNLWSEGDEEGCSPHLVDELAADPHSDIRSLGLVAYELLAGAPLKEREQPPVPVHCEKSIDLSYASRQDYQVPDALGKLFLERKVPLVLEMLISKMLASSPSGGFQTVSEVRTQVDRLLGSSL